MNTDPSLVEQSNRKTAEDFLAALRARNWDAMKAMIESGAVWTLPGTSLISGLASGVEAILNRWQTIVKYGINFELKHILAGRDGAALSLHNTAKRGDLIFDEHLATVLTIHQGKITALNTYLADIPMLNKFFV